MSEPISIPATMYLTPIEIWEPRYHDNVCLIAARKVKPRQHYKIWFSYANKPDKRGALTGQQFYISAAKIKRFPKETNGTIACYAVPMGELKPYVQERVW